MKPVSILEGISRRKGCAVFRLDNNDSVVEAAGLFVTKPESVIGLTIEDKVPYPNEAYFFKELLNRTRSTGEANAMILPVLHFGDVHQIRVCLDKYGPDSVIITVPDSIHIRPNPT